MKLDYTYYRRDGHGVLFAFVLAHPLLFLIGTSTFVSNCRRHVWRSVGVISINQTKLAIHSKYPLIISIQGNGPQ
jgi:hypothetical protein